jgi:hypothetical protein
MLFVRGAWNTCICICMALHLVQLGCLQRPVQWMESHMSLGMSCGFTSLQLAQLLVVGMPVSACSHKHLEGKGWSDFGAACAKRG